MSDLHIDFETRSAVDLRKTGVHVYADDVTTDIWCMAYAFDGDSDVALWLPGSPVPADVYDHIDRGGQLIAHNAAFEIEIWRKILVPRYGFPEAPVERWRCTMAQAYAMALPGALADAAGALRLDMTKDMAGHRQMLSMAKPRKVVGMLPADSHGAPSPPDAEGWQTFTGADGLLLKILWWIDPTRRENLYNYCKQDVRTEMALDKRLLRLRPIEQKLWYLDQKINNAGVVIDERACHAAIDIVDRTRADINKQMKLVSGYKVGASTNVAQISTFLSANGVEVEGMTAEHVKDMLTLDLPNDCRKVLELRQRGSKMSVSKIKALLNRRGLDNRARGMLQYHAAHPGRWGGRGFQPQNLKRPEISQEEIEFFVSILRSGLTGGGDDGRYKSFIAFCNDPIETLGSCIRALLTVDDGRVMGSADYANIEGRVLAWLTGEHWKVKAFEAYDAGEGPDLYKLAFSRSFNTPIDQVSKDDRQIGKVEELALGYQGGPGAFQAMSGSYGVDIGAQIDVLRGTAPGWAVDEADEAWQTYGSRSGMMREDWIAAEIVKRAWRGEHPATVAFWDNIEEAAISAVQKPGTTFTLGRLKFKQSGSFLFMKLPCERAIVYPYPKVEMKLTPWKTKKPTLTFFGQDTYTRQWGRTKTYGGKLTENAVQAIARDILAEAMTRLDAAGVEIVLHVHDEVVFYDDESVTSCDHVCRIMEDSAPWAAGIPVVAEGWIGDRYRK